VSHGAFPATCARPASRMHFHEAYNSCFFYSVFIIALFVLVLWREFNCVKIPQGEINKSANRSGNLRAKGGVVVTPSVFNLRSSCEHQIQFFTQFRCLLLHLNKTIFLRGRLISSKV
jgi:hypothetical protein